jgi:predicted carbohydrate-binding protein with CBM5 and CBM33 domain
MMERFIQFLLPDLGRWAVVDTKHGFFELHDEQVEGKPVYELREATKDEPRKATKAHAEGDTFEGTRVALGSVGAHAAGAEVTPRHRASRRKAE